ncbi:MAG: hypothetical protein RR942_06075 [Romboutsia sp.]
MNTECLFAVNGKVCTRNNICDKEACATKTLLKGYTKCVYLYSKDKVKKEWLTDEKQEK